jgi:hypothetical protein
MCFLTKISFLLWLRFVLDFKGRHNNNIFGLFFSSKNFMQQLFLLPTHEVFFLELLFFMFCVLLRYCEPYF